MPVYEYECTPCRVIYETEHGMNGPAPTECPKCGGEIARHFTAPHLATKHFTSPTEEKYSKLSKTEEIKRERILQGDFQKIWLPPPVKHNPWDDH